MLKFLSEREKVIVIKKEKNSSIHQTAISVQIPAVCSEACQLLGRPLGSSFVPQFIHELARRTRRGPTDEFWIGSPVSLKTAARNWQTGQQ